MEFHLKVKSRYNNGQYVTSSYITHNPPFDLSIEDPKSSYLFLSTEFGVDYPTDSELLFQSYL